MHQARRAAHQVDARWYIAVLVFAEADITLRTARRRAGNSDRSPGRRLKVAAINLSGNADREIERVVDRYQRLVVDLLPGDDARSSAAFDRREMQLGRGGGLVVRPYRDDDAPCSSLPPPPCSCRCACWAWSDAGMNIAAEPASSK